ncbi:MULTISPECIES: AsmA family protein [Hyphobacterium]|uniref:AsmA family protein n=1 Tax=Hyphobacterium vulgare TaxID=1736751 RepID=A0ABV6ZUH5_9PROT
MRRILTILGLLIVLVLGAAIALPFLIPESVYRDRAQIAASDSLGREVVLAGDVSLSILPRLEIRAHDVTIGNAEGFGDEPFAEAGEMRLAVQLWPLINRRVEIDEFALIDPVIRLTEQGGRNNWTFEPRGDQTDAPAASGTGFRQGPGALPFDGTISDVRIENGLIVYTSGGETRTIEGLDLGLKMPGVDEPVEIEGALTTEGESISFDITLGSLRAFFEGARTDLDLSLGGRLVTLTLDGAVLEGEAIAYSGSMDTTIPSLRGLADFLGSPMPEGDSFNRFAASGDISGSLERIALRNASLSLDDLAATGNFILTLGGARPAVSGDLHIPEIDVNPYLPEGGESTGGGAIQPWPETPVDLSPLGLVDADFTLTTGRILFGDIVIESGDSPIQLDLDIVNSRLQAAVTNFVLYEGRGRIGLVANGRGTPSFSLNANLERLDALPFLEAAAGFDRLSGTGALNLDILTTGNTTAALMNGLGGNGRFQFADGAIRGVNLAQVLRNIQSAITSGSMPEGFGEQEETDFSSLNGTFTLANGVATNNDLLMLSPLVRVAGAGTVDIGGQSLDYSLRPRAVASLQGQGGNTDLRGIEIPIRIRGSFASPSVSIDFEAISRALLQGAVTGAISGQDPEDAIRGAIGNALGLGGQDDGEDTGNGEGEDETSTEEQLLRGLLGLGGNRNRQQEEEQPEDGGR